MKRTRHSECKAGFFLMQLVAHIAGDLGCIKSIDHLYGISLFLSALEVSSRQTLYTGFEVVVTS